VTFFEPWVKSTHFQCVVPVESRCEALTLKKTTAKPTRNLIGATIRRIRKSQRTPVSLHDMEGRLAALGIKIDRSAIGRIEKGMRYVLDYEAAAIAKALRVPIADLFPRKRA